MPIIKLGEYNDPNIHAIALIEKSENKTVKFFINVLYKGEHNPQWQTNEHTSIDVNRLKKDFTDLIKLSLGVK